MSKMSFGIDVDGDDAGDVEVDDDELEAELNALMAGQDIRKYKRGDAVFNEPAPKPRNAERSGPSKPPPVQARAAPQRHAGAAAERRPAPSPQSRKSASHAPVHHDDEAGDEDSDIDENDPDLLAELHKYLPTESPSHGVASAAGSSSRQTAFDVDLARDLEARIAAFETSIENSRISGDIAKMRRLQRLSEQVASALADVKANRPVNIEELPMPPSAASSRRESAAPSISSPPTEHRSPKLPSPTSSPEHALRPAAAASPYSDALDSGKTERNLISQPQDHTPAPPRPAAPVNNFQNTNAAHAASSGQHLHNEAHAQLVQQEQQLKVLAVQAKRSGNLDQAKAYLTQYKQVKEQLDTLNGKEIERATYKLPASVSSSVATSVSQMQQQPQQQQQAVEGQQHDADEPVLPHLSDQRMKELTGAPPPPSSIAEALQQRLSKYKESVDKARAESNESKARRMERIVKQYEEAIKDHKRGRPVDFESLPSPPGFGAIPVPAAATAAHPPQQAASGAAAAASSSRAPPGPSSSSTHGAAQPRASTSAAAAASQRSSNQVQLNALIDKQKQFKLAALKAKNDGDIPLAKEYLRKAKGLEQMIEASQSGLPVNLETVPAAPTNQDHYGYEVVGTATLSELRPNVKFDRTAVFKQLEVDLINQVKMCKSNSDTFSKAGDVDMAKRFQVFLKDSIRDLESLRNAFQHGHPPPRFHYETRSFNLAKVHADLPENVLELHIVRAVGLSVKDYEPSQMDTFVVYDFPSPSENHQTGRTPTFRSTNSPMYSSTFNIEINRRSRAIERIFKKQGIKCEIFLKGGLFRADRLLGRVFIDLQQLETKCEMHQAFDIVDEKRKPLSGKLEVKLRLREPLTGKHIEPVKETWLVIDEFAKAK